MPPKILNKKDLFKFEHQGKEDRGTTTSLSPAAHQGGTMQYPQAFSVSGVVVEEKSELPLAGVLVKLTSGNSRNHKKAVGQVELGSGQTDQDGRFTIQVTQDQQAQEALCRLRYKKDAKSFLTMVDIHGIAIGKPTEVNSTEQEVILCIPSGEDKPSQSQWKALTNYLLTNRMMLVRDLAQQFSTPYPDSPTKEWSTQARASGLRAMHDAVVRKASNSRLAVSLLEHDQFIYPDSLESGNVGKAVTFFSDSNNLGRLAEKAHGKFTGAVSLLPWLHKSDLELYRDYLRSVWVGAAQKMYWDDTYLTTSTASVAILESQLDERFHQDFHTSDDTAQPVTKLLIPILVSVLTTGANREGFGLKSSQIPAQGTQTDDEYLQTLIELTNLSTKELRNRFRVSFDRITDGQVSPLQLNVEALLGLLADTYQSPEEPFNAVPPVIGEGKPLIFGPYIGRAPFFLEYEEWVERQSTFYPENIYDIRKNIPLFNQANRDERYSRSFPGKGYFDNPGEKAKSVEWVKGIIAITDRILEGIGMMDAQIYPDALGKKFKEVDDLLATAAYKYEATWMRDRFWWQWDSGAWNTGSVGGTGYPDSLVSLKDRAKLRVTNANQLRAFEMFFDTPGFSSWTGQGTQSDLEIIEESLAKSRTLYIYNVFYLSKVLMPYLRSTIQYTLGNFASAIKELSPLTGYLVGVAEPTSTPGYDPQDQVSPGPYQQDTLPYTTLVGFDKEWSYTDLPFIGNEGDMSGDIGKMAIAPFEKRFFKLAQGEAMLAWADQIYRNDDPSSIRRARELYKGVLFMHGEDPEIAPHFRSASFVMPSTLFWKFQDNPAKVSQVNRARLALFQIEMGLNAYGYCDDMVPVLRYKPLKQAADIFAMSAKSSQTDFLNYMTRFEEAQVEIWQTQSMVKKAEASSGIAREHIAIAQVGVDKAKEQVAAVEGQIAAKNKEIADKDSFFAQASDFFSGVKDSLTGMVPLAKKVIADESPAGVVTSDQLLTIAGKGATGGASGANEAAVATLGSGAGFMIGFGTFIYTSYSSMQSMEEASNKRAGDLKSLESAALPAAKAQVRLKERDTAIAQYELQIADADSEYARMMFRFQKDRFLSADFWNKLSLFANRLMRRYVELGARSAWMAERALVFEQNRDVRIIKLNYLPTALRGVTGADRLLADLAELEANRLQGIRLTTPVKHTISLVRDFPIQFGQLKKTGHCHFRTVEANMRQAYPGTFGYRIRAITVAVSDADGAPPRGILRNQGVSVTSHEDLSTTVMVRFTDALPLSEFRLHEDLFVYGLPGETLMQFEGSGFETDWELEFPIVANPKGFSSITDVLIVFDMNAYYSQLLASKQANLKITDSMRSIAIAASNLDLKGLATLKAATGPVRMTFDLTKLALPTQEVKQMVTNLAVICVGKTTLQYIATLNASNSAKMVSFTIDGGIALSNAGPLLGTKAPLALNDLINLNVNQPFVLEIDRTGVAGELKGLFDVVLYLEYKASF